MGLLFVIAAIVAAVVFQGNEEALGYSVPQLPGAHNPPYEYVTQIEVDGEVVNIPPTSGNHLSQWGPYGFLGFDIVPEAVVHNMEHGAVVIWYKPGDPELAGRINSLVKDIGSECIVAGSYEDMSFQVAATVWGRVLPQETYDEAALKTFIDKYRGTEGPEAGLCANQS